MLGQTLPGDFLFQTRQRDQWACNSSLSQCTAAEQKAEVSHSLTYLIGTLVATTVAALHGVASGHPHLSPHHYPGCGGPRFLHKEAATAHGKRWCKFIKDFGKSLQLRKSNYGELQKIESMHH